MTDQAGDSMRARVRYWLAPGLPTVEMIAADYLAQRFSPHWHAGFAIGTVTREEQGFHCGGAAWRVGPGDLILLNPGVVHDGFALGHLGWSSRMAYVPSDLFLALAGLDGEPPLGRERFANPVVHQPALCRLFVEWHHLSESACDLRTHPLAEVLFRGLARFLEPLPQAGSRPRGASVLDLDGSLSALAEGGQASVAKLTGELALSRSALWRRMKAELGIAPKPFLQQLRLRAARNLIVAGSPLVDAALACGFHDQSHLTMQFGAAFGMTPAQFRRVQLGQMQLGR